MIFATTGRIPLRIHINPRISFRVSPQRRTAPTELDFYAFFTPISVQSDYVFAAPRVVTVAFGNRALPFRSCVRDARFPSGRSEDLSAAPVCNYFEVRSADAQKKLLDDTVKAYSDALQQTKYRFEGGVAPKADVSQAQTQLDQTRVQASDIMVLRSQYEHALAILIGRSPVQFHLDPTPINLQAPLLPDIPVTLPSQLLERRPDVAEAERLMAAENEQIGIAKSAYYPALNLAAVFGVEGTNPANWFDWPSRFWAVGLTLSETLFDGGRRRATTESALAAYDGSVANYRQTVLNAYGQVEDNLVALHILNTESAQQHSATAAAEESLQLSQDRYAGGVDTYLQVVIWQTTALTNERNDIDIMRRRLEANVLLIKALGGGWDVRSLPRV